MESVQNHLAEQGARADRIAGSLGALADSLAHIPDASQGQLEALAAIKDQMATDAGGMRRLQETLAQLPQIADAQRETMVTIARHLEESRETARNVAATLDGFRQSITQVSEATSVTGRTIEKIRWDQAAHDERLTGILREQTKRLTHFAWGAVALAAVAATAGVIALFRSSSG